jgi:NAD(P)-dependent dehydrogenase (short-subunit alcohol dehydrogenase family)
VFFLSVALNQRSVFDARSLFLDCDFGPLNFGRVKVSICMSRIFITGSADGLGQMAAKLLVDQGHRVVLHARNPERGRQAMIKVPGAENVLIGDLSSLEETKQLAADANSLGRFDAIIHNAGVYRVANRLTFAVNSLAPYVLTCLIQRPQRLIYLSSGMHLNGITQIDRSTYDRHGYTYSDSKLHVVILSMAVARKWADTYSNAVDPGWVPTRMGGRGAPDDLEKGFETQSWLAVSDDDKAKVSGRYFHHMKAAHYRAEANDVRLQEKFLMLCEEISGVKLVAPDS